MVDRREELCKGLWSTVGSCQEFEPTTTTTTTATTSTVTTTTTTTERTEIVEDVIVEAPVVEEVIKHPLRSNASAQSHVCLSMLTAFLLHNLM